jgi:threonine/homoserine/homoserine lactone efflux protein
MSISAWIVLLGTFTVAVASPGPDFLAVLRRTLERGLHSGMRTAAGVAAGIATWLCLALFGIVGLIARHHVLFFAVRIAGAVFLVFYGLSILRALWRAHRERSRDQVRERDIVSRDSDTPAPEDSPCGSTVPEPAAQPPADPTASSHSVNAVGMKTGTGARQRFADVRLGYLTNTVGNPKAVVFFGALFVSVLPQAITLGESLLAGAVMTGIALAFFTLVALLSSRPLVIRAYERAQTAIDTFLGVLFVILGLVLIPWTGL